MKQLLFMGLMIVSSLITACSPVNTGDVNQVAELNSAGTWIDSPLYGAQLPLADHVMVFHSTSQELIDQFEIQVNGQTAGLVAAELAEGQENQGLYVGQYLWQPEVPGLYLLEVIALSGDGQESGSAQAQIVIAEEQVQDDQVPEAEDVEPVEESVPATTEVTETCNYTSVANLFCRTGPGSVYPEIDSFVPDTIAEVLGFSPDGFYAQVLGPNFGEACYVPLSEQFGSLSGDCEDLPVLSIPPTPTLTPTFTPEPQQATTATPIPPQCSDGIDNDGDGDIDMNDGRCLSPQDDDENR
ncbi:MAG: hypothetical protein DWQ07_22410 [Chloroflexi bacterium]|nr:MAG: hypothetical protein DWQ07_22410 [Chloroflexota bacterium]MBL1193902.1 hypothetical protein [Chloroflexota bacterium]NOH11196.1 hypothetical protein [Chloroflexota bacterium]